jgi:hypothetical protein
MYRLSFERPSCCYVLRLLWKQKEFFGPIDLRILSLILVTGAKRQCFLAIAMVSTSCNMALAEGATCCACTGGRWFPCENCKIGQCSSSSRDGSTPMHGKTFCRWLKHFKQIHTVPSFCRTLTQLVNSHAFALCRPKISLNGCSVSALILCLSTAHMVLNNHNMQLYTTVIPCEARQGLPAAFCLVYAPGVPFDIRYTLFSLCCHAST